MYEVWAAQCVNRSCGEWQFKIDLFILRFLLELWLIAGLVLAVASLTFLVWDVLTTWDEELAYIWRSVTNPGFVSLLSGLQNAHVLPDIPFSLGLQHCSNANSSAHRKPLTWTRFLFVFIRCVQMTDLLSSYSSAHAFSGL